MNENILNKAYRQLPDNYLFSTIARKITDYQTSHPGIKISAIEFPCVAITSVAFASIVRT